MVKLDDLFTIEVLDEDKCAITFTTSVDVGLGLKRLLKEGLFNRDVFEKIIKKEHDDYFKFPGLYIDCFYAEWEEVTGNDKRVVEQYDPDYYAFLEWVRDQKSLGVPGLDTYHQIERLWKLHKIRKLMKGK